MPQYCHGVPLRARIRTGTHSWSAKAVAIEIATETEAQTVFNCFQVLRVELQSWAIWDDLNGYILCFPALEGLTACHTCWYVKAVAIEIATETEAQTVFNCFQVLSAELQSWAIWYYLNGYILCFPALEGLTACHICWYVKAVAIEIATETEAQTVFNCFQVLSAELQSWAIWYYLNGYMLCFPALEGLTACHICWYVKAVAIEIATEDRGSNSVVFRF